MRRRFTLFTLILPATATLAVAVAYAQFAPIRLLVGEVESDETPFVGDDAYPSLSLEVVPANAAGVPVAGLDAADFSLLEDGTPVDTFELASFINVDQPASLMVVIDVSESMGDDLPELKTSLISLYDILGQSDESGIVAFSLRADGTAVNLAEPFPQLDPNREMTFTSDEGALINFVNALSVEQGSGAPLYDALVKGVRLTALQARHERRALVLVTDGFDADRNGNPPGSNMANAGTAIGEAQQHGIPVFTVGVGSAADSAFLERAANSSGGAYWSIADAGQVAPVLASVVAQLKQAYRLQVTASAPPDNAIHTLTVAARTAAGEAEVTVEYKARYPDVPLVRDVMAAPAHQAPRSLAAMAAVKGTVAIEPDIVARGNVTAVNYYVGDSQMAVFTAREAPWTLIWDTSRLTSGQTHQLVIEILDDADPPHVGVFETPVFVEACRLLCQVEQRLGFNPVYLAAGLGLVAIMALALLRRRSTHATPYPPQPGRQPAAVPPQQHRFDVPPQSAGESDPFRPFSRQPAALPAEAMAPPPTATEVLNYDPNSIAFLIDSKSGHAFRLGVETTIGRDPDNDLVFNEARVADYHARVVCLGAQYVLATAKTTHSTKVNRQEVTRHELIDGDRVELGGWLLVFRQVK